MVEIWFYHLLSQSLERALPNLLERALSRGWRAVVQAADEERVKALDDLLWTFSDESFLAHGRASDGDGALQPVWLTSGKENPNGAQIRFYVGGADIREALGQDYSRAVLIFDGNDDEAVAAAREHWRWLKQQSAPLAYWRQGEDGRWEKMD